MSTAEPRPSAVQPLLQYRENFLGTKRVVLVYDDRVEVALSEALVGSAQLAVPLATLSPEPVRGARRRIYFHLGLYGLIPWFIAWSVLEGIPSVDLSSSDWWLFWAAPLLLILFIVIAIRPVRFVNFVNTAGVTVFGIVQQPPDHEKFDSFVSELSALSRQATLRRPTCERRVDEHC